LRSNSDEAAKTVKELVNVGQANQSDVLQAEVAAQRAKANLQMSESRYRSSWEELAAVIGMPDMQPTHLEGKLDFQNVKPLERDATLADLLTCSPELLVARAEVARDRLAVKRERVESVPNLNFRAATGYNFETRDTVANVEVGVRLPLFDKNQGTIMQAGAELTRAEAEVTRIELSLRRRFAQTFRNTSRRCSWQKAIRTTFCRKPSKRTNYISIPSKSTAPLGHRCLIPDENTMTSIRIIRKTS